MVDAPTVRSDWDGLETELASSHNPASDRRWEAGPRRESGGPASGSPDSAACKRHRAWPGQLGIDPGSKTIAEEAALEWAEWTEAMDGPPSETAQPKLGGTGQASGSEVMDVEEEKGGGLPPAAPRKRLELVTVVKAGSHCAAASASSEEPRTKTARKEEQEQVPKVQPVAGPASSAKWGCKQREGRERPARGKCGEEFRWHLARQLARRHARERMAPHRATHPE